MRTELKKTRDGSYTLFVPEINEHYHSIHGAISESRHVFIKMGLLALPEDEDHFNILEAGLGTGLNLMLTVLNDFIQNRQVHYHGIEAFPPATDILQQLNYHQEIDHPEAEQLFWQIHKASWETDHLLQNDFLLHKTKSSLEEVTLPSNHFHLIYFDAFAPNKQPELWEESIFRKMYIAMKPGGLLVTYCAKGQVRRNMISAGFEVERLPGPPGKREMLRAKKN